MTMKNLMTLVLGLALIAAVPAAAHEGESSGSMIEGEVITATADTVAVKTDDGTATVELSSETSLSLGDETVTAAALKPGMHVMVHGNKLPGGSMAAQHIAIHAMDETQK